MCVASTTRGKATSGWAGDLLRDARVCTAMTTRGLAVFLLHEAWQFSEGRADVRGIDNTRQGDQRLGWRGTCGCVR
jgi:hypothetical protein